MYCVIVEGLQALVTDVLEQLKHIVALVFGWFSIRGGFVIVL